MTKDYSSLDIFNWNIHWALNNRYPKKKKFGSESAVLSFVKKSESHWIP